MLIQLNSPQGASFDILNSDSDLPLVPKALEITTQDSLVGYEIIEGYAHAVNIQPYRKVEGVSSLQEAQKHARNTASFWFSNVSRAINEVYNGVQNGLKITQNTVKDYFDGLLEALEQAEKREEFIELIKMYLDDTKTVEEKIKALQNKLTKFREYLEKDARNYGQVRIELDKQQSLDEKKIKLLLEEISGINKEITELNEAITKKKVEVGELKRKIAISALFWFSIPGLIALAVHKKQLADVNANWAQDENTLESKKTALAEKTTALAETNKSIAYITTLSNEFTKLHTDCLKAITTVVNMAEAWGTLSSNLENIQKRLSTLKDNDLSNFSKVKTKMKFHIKALQNSINKLNTDIDKFNEAKLIKVAVDEKVGNLLLPGRAKLMYPAVDAFSSVLLKAYAQRMHKHNFESIF